MDASEVATRIRRGEDERTEFGRFRTFAEKDWLAAACAMANSDGGLIVLGVLDDGTIDGVPMSPEQVREHLTTQLQSGASDAIPGRLGHATLGERVVHWILVERRRRPSPLKHRGRVLIRRGRSTTEPSDSELAELYNAFGFVLTEERVLPDTTPADIEPAAFRSWMARKGVDLSQEPTLPLETDLLNRGVVDRDAGGAVFPTLYGILCFGRDPQAHGPTRAFLVDCVAYIGRDRADEVLTSAVAGGRVDEQVSRAEAWFRSLGRREHYQHGVRTDEWIVPLEALREALVNAVAHRDYALVGARGLLEVFDDRAVITSPGALPNHLRPESVIAGGLTRSRNESIAQFLHDLGRMEGRGTGFPRMRRAMQKWNGTEPEIETDRDARYVRVTFRRLAP